MPRFVLLYHDCPPNYERTSHWDFMLESGDVLRTWALERLPCDWQVVHARTAVAHPKCPLFAGEHVIAALQLSDHRRDYLELEGPLSGDRGTVTRVAAGTYNSEYEAAGEWRVMLASAELPGRVLLSRTEVDGEQWKLSTEY